MPPRIAPVTVGTVAKRMLLLTLRGFQMQVLGGCGEGRLVLNHTMLLMQCALYIAHSSRCPLPTCVFVCVFRASKQMAKRKRERNGTHRHVGRFTLFLLTGQLQHAFFVVVRE